MKSAIFSTTADCYQVSNIIYAGPVVEIPEDKRRNGSTHRFKMLTVAGPVYCYYKDSELARKARAALGMILEEVKSTIFRSAGEAVDAKKIISFSRVLPLKKTDTGRTHGFVITLDVAEERSKQIWFTYTSEESAERARKALFAAIHSANGMSLVTSSQQEAPAAMACA